MHEVSQKRPVGIIILSVLHVIIAVYSLWNEIASFRYFDDVLTFPGINLRLPYLLVVSPIVYLGLLFASAIGMWLGRIWGWHLAIATYLVMAIRVIFPSALNFSTSISEVGKGYASSSGIMLSSYPNIIYLPYRLLLVLLILAIFYSNRENLVLRTRSEFSGFAI